ncbi:hypothetical protein Gotri_010503 [Gossypium trilobum]|uniref:Uncharacterized protein n=1 Tax=Gossypium trilobum TaxID=34281 RepID=A0A7J9ER54_9ROSI|nr:hypothetical protein [Gossypium trilobum]
MVLVESWSLIRTLLGETIDKHDSQLLEDEEELIKMDSKGDEPIPNNDIADEEGKPKWDLELIDLGYDFFLAKLVND